MIFTKLCFWDSLKHVLQIKLTKFHDQEYEGKTFSIDYNILGLFRILFGNRMACILMARTSARNSRTLMCTFLGAADESCA